MAESILESFDRVTDGTEKAFSPAALYNPYGDCIHYHWQGDEFYADRIDDKLTVYRSTATNDAVGCQIKGVMALVDMLGSFGISLKNQDGTPLAMFLFASRSAADLIDNATAASRERVYKYVLERAGKARVELQFSA